LLHVLPGNFYKIRYYGIWSSRPAAAGQDEAQMLPGAFGSGNGPRSFAIADVQLARLAL
jgi:hypothetical protein